LKKILILGGAGFIGLDIARYLLKNRACEITIADIFSTAQKDKSFKQLTSNYPINIIEGDFTNLSNYNKLDSTYDYVYMLASVVGVNKCIEQPHEVIRINTSLIQNTLEWIINNKIGKVLFSSSSECYAATTEIFNYKVPTSEEVPLTISDISHPRFTYAVTKILGESAFLTYGKKYNFPVTIVRYQNIFGPRMGFKHVIPHLIERFYNKEEPFKIYGPKQTRAFCYISDASEGTVLAMESELSNQEIYHIGSPQEITIEELTKTVGEIMGYNGKYIDSSTYPGSVSKRCPDILKSQTQLNYFPKIGWQEGLKYTTDWYLDFFKSGEPITSGGFKAPEDLSFKG
jgi:UDP-glucose 4-epimerase